MKVTFHIYSYEKGEIVSNLPTEQEQSWVEKHLKNLYSINLPFDGEDALYEILEVARDDDHELCCLVVPTLEAVQFENYLH